MRLGSADIQEAASALIAIEGAASEKLQLGSQPTIACSASSKYQDTVLNTEEGTSVAAAPTAATVATTTATREQLNLEVNWLMEQVRDSHWWLMVPASIVFQLGVFASSFLRFP